MNEIQMIIWSLEKKIGIALILQVSKCERCSRDEGSFARAPNGSGDGRDVATSTQIDEMNISRLKRPLMACGMVSFFKVFFVVLPRKLAWYENWSPG